MQMRAMLAFQARLLKRATEICGGFGALALRLAVSELQLKSWSNGNTRLPDQVFLRVADIVLEDDIARAAQDRRINPRVASTTVKISEAPAGHA